MQGLSLMKRFAALSLAAVTSLSVFGGVGFNNTKVSSNAVISGAAADENSDYEEQLAELERQKAELDEKIAAAGDDIKGNQEKLDAINEKALTIREKMEKISSRASKLEDEMCDLDAEMRDTQYQLEQSEEEIAKGIEDFKGRLRAMYIAGNDSYSEVLINADNFYDVLMRVELVKRVAAHDNETIDSLLEQKAQIEKYKEELEEQSAALKEKSAEYAKQQADLAQQQSELLEMQEKYGDSIEALNIDLSDYQSQMDMLSDEYNKVSEAAKTTTTTTAEPAETEKTESEEKAKTTKKDSSEPGGGEDENTEETKKTTTKPETEPAETQKPAQTEAPTTTKKPETTTSAPAAKPEPEPDPEPDNSRETKINTVVAYAKSMVGGRYVWGGEQFGATDCSGLVMLSYAQIGISLPHLASAQAGYGTSVSYSNIQPGDLVFYGGSSYSSIYHVAMYIGDGKIVHAESSATGIVISYYDSVAKYNPVSCIKRII